MAEPIRPSQHHFPLPVQPLINDPILHCHCIFNLYNSITSLNVNAAINCFLKVAVPQSVTFSSLSNTFSSLSAIIPHRATSFLNATTQRISPPGVSPSPSLALQPSSRASPSSWIDPLSFRVLLPSSAVPHPSRTWSLSLKSFPSREHHHHFPEHRHPQPEHHHALGMQCHSLQQHPHPTLVSPSPRAHLNLHVPEPVVKSASWASVL